MTFMLILKNTFPGLIIKAALVDVFDFRLPKITVPISILLAVGTMIPFSQHINEWWYVPSWMIATLSFIYVVDLAMAIRLTGKLKGLPWEFRSDRFQVWVANYIGVLLVLGLLHFLPLASKAMFLSLKIEGLKADAAYYSLLTTAWGAFIGICISNIFSALSNAARAGVMSKELAGWIIKRFDTYKPSVYDLEKEGSGKGK